jgi:hypothetical protein
MKIVRITCDKRVQDEVNRHATQAVAKVADLTIPALELFDETPLSVFHRGIATGNTLALLRGKSFPDCKIFEATHSYRSGKDVFYFIGRRDQVLDALRKLPIVQDKGPALGWEEDEWKSELRKTN